MTTKAARSGLRVWRTILVATGVHASLIPLGLALLATVIWHDGTINAIGPLTLAAPLPVVVAAPTLLAVACGISHVPPRTPVIRRNARTVAARALSHLTILGAGLAIITLGDLLTPLDTIGPATRNLMVFAALALVVAGLAGPAYAWAPVVVLFGIGVLSNPSEGTWSTYALVMAPTVQPAQLVVAVPICLVAVAVAALDPLGLAYLPGGRHGATSGTSRHTAGRGRPSAPAPAGRRPA